MDLELPEDPEFWRAVAVVAEFENVSPDEAIRRAILAKAAALQREAETMAAYEAVSAKYRDALDRLGDN